MKGFDTAARTPRAGRQGTLRREAPRIALRSRLPIADLLQVLTRLTVRVDLWIPRCQRGWQPLLERHPRVWRVFISRVEGEYFCRPGNDERCSECRSETLSRLPVFGPYDDVRDAEDVLDENRRQRAPSHSTQRAPGDERKRAG